MQSWLVFENYPDVDMVRVTIWNLRENRKSYSVEFLRSDKMAIESRVRHAAGLAVMHSQAEKAPPGWPTTEKCEMCSLAMRCNVADTMLVVSPEFADALVDQLVALNAKSAGIEKALTKIVADRGEDIETPAGNRFGFEKPKRKTKPKAVLYSGSESSGDDDGAEVSADNPFTAFRKGKL